MGWVDALEKGMATDPLQYSCLENPMDRGALQVTVCGVTKSWTGLSTHTQQDSSNSRLIILSHAKHMCCLYLKRMLPPFPHDRECVPVGFELLQ